MAQVAGSRLVRMPRGRTSSGAARQPRVTTGPYGQKLLGNDTLSTELSTTARIVSEGDQPHSALRKDPGGRGQLG